jgi:hypothetical protein
MGDSMKPASIWDWLGPFALMAVFIAYLFLSTPSEIVLCRGEEDCFRNWLGTIGAIAAVVAASVGSYFVYGQLAEQRRQTAFLIGDAPPTIEAHWYSATGRRARFAITNWNRRNISMVGADFVLPGASGLRPNVVRYGREETEDDDIDLSFRGDREFTHAPIVFGWIKRDESPNRLYISFEYESDQLWNWVDEIEDEILHHFVDVTCTYYFDNHERHTISVRARVFDLLPKTEGCEADGPHRKVS